LDLKEMLILVLTLTKDFSFWQGAPDSTYKNGYPGVLNQPSLASDQPREPYAFTGAKIILWTDERFGKWHTFSSRIIKH